MQTPAWTLAIGRREFIAMIATMMALNALALDIMLPAFPDIVASFGLTDPNEAQYVLLAYVVGFGSAQLLFGPLSDRFGRRKPLFWGLTLYLGCAFAGAIAPSFESLLALRFVQGVGAASTRVIALSVVRDTHSGRAMASTMSLVMMVFMVIPVIAPTAGQLIVLFGEWHTIFLFMGLVALAATLWFARRLPETLDEDRRRPLSAEKVIEGFRLVLTNRLSLFYALATAVYFGSLFAFMNTAQPIYTEIYDLGAWFPVAFAAVAIVMAAASFANSRLVNTIGQRRLAHGALCAHLLLSTLMLILVQTTTMPLWLFLLMMSLIMPLFGLVGANFNSIAMEPLGAVAGTASSILGFCQTVGGGIVGTIIGQAYDGTLAPLAAGLLAVSAVTLSLVLVAERGRLFGVTEQ